MIKILKEAIDQVTALPEADQEQIGRDLLEHALKIRALRADLQAGLDAGRGKELDIGDVLKRARSKCQIIDRPSFHLRPTRTSWKSRVAPAHREASGGSPIGG